MQGLSLYRWRNLRKHFPRLPFWSMVPLLCLNRHSLLRHIFKRKFSQMNLWYSTPVTSYFNEGPCPQNTSPVATEQNAKCELVFKGEPMSLTITVILSTPSLFATLRVSRLPSSPKCILSHLSTLICEFSP